jgi:hypothetical protein
VKVTVQIVIDAQDGTPPAVEQVAAIARDDLTMASAGCHRDYRGHGAPSSLCFVPVVCGLSPRRGGA